MHRYGSRRSDNDYGHKEKPVHGAKSSRARAKREVILPPSGAFCSHHQMQECHPAVPRDGRPGCGHFICPCGVSWDEGVGM